MMVYLVDKAGAGPKAACPISNILTIPIVGPPAESTLRIPPPFGSTRTAWTETKIRDECPMFKLIPALSGVKSNDVARSTRDQNQEAEIRQHFERMNRQHLGQHPSEDAQDKTVRSNDGRRNTLDGPRRRRATFNMLLPPYTDELHGPREVRVLNPNSFQVTGGIRSSNGGVDFRVRTNGVASVFIPDGHYDVYFVYSNRKGALFQGDSFVLDGNGVEIRIVEQVNGNYGIRQVK